MIDSSVSDCRIGMRIETSDNIQTYLNFRCNLVNGTFFRFGYSQSTDRLLLQKFSPGGATLTMVYGFPMTAGDWYSVELRGPEIRLFHNNTHFATVEDTMNQTETQHGIQTVSQGTFIDSFFVEALPQ